MPPGGNNEDSGAAGGTFPVGIAGGTAVGGPTPVSVFTVSTDSAIPASNTKDKLMSGKDLIELI
jgi:hypothetical protein